MRRGGARGDADAGGNARAADYGSGHVAKSRAHSHGHARADTHGDAGADAHGSARAATRYPVRGPGNASAHADAYRGAGVHTRSTSGHACRRGLAGGGPECARRAEC